MYKSIGTGRYNDMETLGYGAQVVRNDACILGMLAKHLMYFTGQFNISMIKLAVRLQPAMLYTILCCSALELKLLCSISC